METIKLNVNCDIKFYPNFLNQDKSNELYEYLTSHYDLSDQKIKTVLGDEIKLDTGKCMFVDTNDDELMGLHDSFGQKEHWPELLIELKNKIEKICSRTFDVCVCVYYKNGKSAVDFHSDLTAFGDTSLIPSFSLGTERDFIFRSISKQSEQHRLKLNNGSLLLMGEGCQENYEHSLPRDDKVKTGRINLTFRKYGYK